MKICFLETEPLETAYFARTLDMHELLFVDSLADVPGDTKILSVFIASRIDQAFLVAHSSIELVATRSTTVDHIDLETCARCVVAVVHVESYGDHVDRLHGEEPRQSQIEGQGRAEQIEKSICLGKLLARPNLVFTPRTAFNCVEFLERINTTTVANVKGFIDGTLLFSLPHRFRGSGRRMSFVSRPTPPQSVSKQVRGP
ncbi:MAG TPA: hypothetical protein VK961_27845, partial [Chthoniobacter sp.]|nr:hypothetical protein [Chthoniobacter sp.]